MQNLWKDLRHGVRLLHKQPAFSGLALLTLALGIGAATTIFSVIQNVLFDPFPGHNVERVVAFHIVDAADASGRGRSYFQVPEFLDYQAQVQSFEEMIAGTNEGVLHTTREGTEQFSGGLVSPNNFAFLGVPAQLGRALVADDALPGAPPVFVMTHKMWMVHFGGDPAILGRTFILNDVPTTLVGVMPPRFAKLGADLYRPIALERADAAQRQQFFLLQARLRPGVTLRQAEAEIDVVARRIAATYPKLYPRTFTVKVVPLLDSVIGPFRKTLYTLGAAVGLLLLIACSNVANMLLTRATVREREMALRASLGASRARLVRQLLLESFVLALAGGALGCVFAHFGIQALVAAIPDGTIPRQTVIRLNLPVLFFSFVVAGLTAVLCGLVPALQAARKDLVTPLKDAGKGMGAGGSHRWRNALVVGEVALSLVLLAGAGLLMRSFVKLQTVDLGLNPEGLYYAQLALPRGSYKTAADKHRFYRAVVARVRALPGVVAASTTTSFPMYGARRSEVDVPGKTHPERWEAVMHLVGESYDEALALRQRQGRFLSEVDLEQARQVAVVNQAFVQRYFGADDPLGRTITLSALSSAAGSPVVNPSFEVVGVVADSKNQGVHDPVSPEAFVPATITGAYDRGILVRTSGSVASLGEAVKREIWATDRNVALNLSGSLTDALKRFSYAGPRLVLVILGVFAAVGLVLVVIGVFSVIAYTVSRQTRDIGVRMALGARGPDVARLVLGLGLRLIGGGIVVGTAASLGLTRVLSSHLFGVAPHDPATLATVIAVVITAGLLACSLPARRATRVDPMVALRYD